MNADLVIGQTNFTNQVETTTQSGMFPPTGVAFDSSGNLFVADESNARVLEFNPPFSDGMNAGVVIGQVDFTSKTQATTQSGLRKPDEICIDAFGNLWVPDQSNNRVLEFQPPFTNGMNASVVLGQPNFTAAAANTSQNSLFAPYGCAADSSGDIFVSDFDNNRVLEFKPPFTNGMNASVVFGQPDFTSGSFATTQTGLAVPTGVAIDSNGNLWVVDEGNNRVVEYQPPFTNGMAASQVIGQASFTSATGGQGANNLQNPFAAAFAP